MKKIAAVCLSVALFAAGPAYSAWFDSLEVRSYDGSGNNASHPEWGSVGEPLLRFVAVGYADGIMSPGGENRENPRVISNTVAVQDGLIYNGLGASDCLWQWGQFLDHDISLTPEVHPVEPFDIQVPAGDPFFDPDGTGNEVIPLNRALHNHGSTLLSPREQLNVITAFIDASNVYGSSDSRAAALRAFSSGKLKIRNDRYLIFNEDGLPNAPTSDSEYYLAGDVRANEQIRLLAMHTLFVREHNRLCDEISSVNPTYSDEEIYQWARKIVGAQMQVITYNEFLPVLLGQNAMPAYSGYDPSVNPGIANEFSTAVFRLGHSLLSPGFDRLNNGGNVIKTVDLKDTFFNPHLLKTSGGIDSIFRGLAAQRAQLVDNKIVDGVRNFLFGEPGEGGLDLASLNIQRGREHGIADFNTIRKAYGLAGYLQIDDITSDPLLLQQLAAVYPDVNDIDPWVGCLAEEHLPGAMVGETIFTVVRDQFIRLRDGDRFWYRNDPFFTSNPDLLAEVAATKLSDIIRRNTKIDTEIQDDVFYVP